MPTTPNALLGTTGSSWVDKVSAKTTIDDIDSHCLFSPENETELQDLQKRISETSPNDKATLITDVFVQRFNDELKALGAARLKVKLIKSKVSKGKVLHILQLYGTAHNPNEVLCEGENRIVSADDGI